MLQTDADFATRGIRDASLSESDLGPRRGRNFDLGEGLTLTIGRGEKSDTKLADSSVSRLHCTVKWEHGKFLLSHFDSVGGTRIKRPVARGPAPVNVASFSGSTSAEQSNQEDVGADFGPTELLFKTIFLNQQSLPRSWNPR